MPMETADLADAFLGIQFLPLDKLSFLKVSSIVHSVEQVLPCIHSTTILYQDQIVWYVASYSSAEHTKQSVNTLSGPDCAKKTFNLYTIT